MNIPIEIVRKGKSEEYASAYEAKIISSRELEIAKSEHEDALWNLLRAIKKDHSTVVTLDNRWQQSLIIEELAKKIVTLAGIFAEKEAEHNENINRFSLLQSETE